MEEKRNQLSEEEQFAMERQERLERKKQRKKLKKEKEQASNEKLVRWLDKTDRRIYPFVAMLCVAVSFFFVYILGRGGTGIWQSDLSAQYYDFLAGYRKILLNGDAWGYSFNMGMGFGLAGTWAYYLMSPFNVITLLFPEKYLLEVISFIITLKVSCMALTFGFYARYVLKRKGMETLIFSYAYGFCGFVISYYFHMMWLDALILLPIIAILIKRLIDYNKIVLLTVTLWILFVTNFYMGYITGACSFLMFCTYYCIKYKKIFSLHFFKCLFQFLGSAAIAVAMSAFLVIPALYQLQDRMGDAVDSTLFQNIFNVDVFTIYKQCFMNLHENLQSGPPLLYTGIITLFLSFFYFFNKRIKKRERKVIFALLLCMLCIMTLRPLTMLMYAGSQNRFFQYRYAFFVSFILASVSCRQFPYILKLKKRTVGIFTAGNIVFLVGYYVFASRISQNIDITYINQMQRTLSHNTFVELVLNVLMLLVYTVVLILAIAKRLDKRSMALLLCVLMIGEHLLCSYSMAENRKREYSLDDVWALATIQNMRQATNDKIDAIQDKDEAFYRMGTNYRISENVGFGLGYKGVDTFVSMNNDKLCDLFGQLGWSHGIGFVYNKGGTPVSNALFGIKYILHTSSNVYNEADELTKEQIKDEIYVAENPYALPVGFMVDEKLKEVELTSDTELNPFENQNIVLSAMLGKQIKCFQKCEVEEPTLVNLEKNEEITEGIFYEWLEEGRAMLKYKVPLQYGKGRYYSFQQNTHVEGINDDGIQTIWHYANGDGKEYKDLIYRSGDEYQSEIYIVDLTGDPDKINWDDINYGYLNEKGELTVDNESLCLADSINGEIAIWFTEPQFYYLNEEVFSDAYEELQKNSLQIENYYDGYIEGKITVKDARLLYTSIPYEEGWKVKVDGKETEITPILGDALIGIDMAEGEHSIIFYYEVPGFKTSAAISLFGLGIFLLTIILGSVKVAIQKKVNA